MMISPTFMRAFMPALFFLGCAVSFIACKKEESSIGLEVQPPGEQLGVLHTDTFTLEAYTVKDDSIFTDEKRYSLFGSRKDAIFGTSKASFFAHLRLASDNISIDSLPFATIDSVVLALKYQGYYGKLTPQTIRVFEVTEDFLYANSYYSNVNLSYDPSELGSIINHTPNLTSKVIIGKDSLDPQLRIKLNNAFGQRIFNLSGQSELANNTNFLAYFKGLYIQSDNPTQQSDEGAILTTDLLSTTSKLTIYYRVQNVPKTFDLLIDGNSARIGKFEHDYAGTPVESQLGNTGIAQPKVYLQAMGGLKVKLDVKFLSNIKQLNKNIAINKAELIIPVDESVDTTLSPNGKIELVAIDENGKSVDLHFDKNDVLGYYGGEYNKTNKEFKINIVRHIHQLINENKQYHGFYLRPVEGSVGNQTILKGGNPLNQMKFKITYTEL